MGIMNASHDEQQGPADDNQQERGVVVSQNGMGVAAQRKGGEEARDPSELVEHPGKVMRIASMIQQLLEEPRSALVEQAGHPRLAEIHRRSISELEEGLAPELI